jgi:hypothetical protein
MTNGRELNGLRALWPTLSLQEGRGLLAYHNAGRHRVAGRHTRHDGRIGYAETFHTVDSQFAVHHGHRIAAA